jgi:serine/threonine protein kinase/TPR repeat protein
MSEPVRFDHYEVLTRSDGALFELGRGAMGVTYKAIDTNLRIPVCLKVIAAAHLESDVARQRFIREARSAARLRNAHVAAVYHLGVAGETYYYAMEFIDGETVEALIKRSGPLTPQLALELTDQVARALGAAEPHGLVHRDIKPANLMVVREGDTLLVKVIDFGLAKSSLPGEESATLSMGGFVGTPHFASPEQLEERDLDVRSDIYSLGVTLWFMLAGRVPFSGSLAQVMSQHLAKPPPFEKLNVPAPLARLLRAMLEKEADNRPQNAAELRRMIAECRAELSGSESAAAPMAPSPGDSQEHFVTQADVAQSEVREAKFEPGAVVAARYRILAALGDTNLGHIFHAHDQTRGEDVRLILLHENVVMNGDVLAALERAVEKLAPRPHANVVRVDALESVGRACFLVLEWFEGATLVEVLRARRELTAPEVVALLGPMASAVDHVLAAGSEEIDPGLHHVWLAFPQPPDPAWLRAPVGDWPPHAVKVNPFSLRGALAAGGATMVDAPVAASGSATARAVRAVAAIVYELLGGKVGGVALSGKGHEFKPLAALGEAGNEVLRRALAPEPPFSSVRSFAAALAEPEAADLPRHSTHAASRAPVPAPAPTPQPPVGPAPHGSPAVLIAAVVLLLVVLLGGGAFFIAQKLRPRPVAVAPHEGMEVAPPGHEDPSPDVSGPEPPPALPRPTPAPPKPDPFKLAVERAQGFERQEAWPECLAAWVQVARDFPEKETGRTNLENVCFTMRVRPDGMKPEVFATLRAPLTDAAQLGVISAMMVLGENLRRSEPGAAFEYFKKAGELGDPEGMVQAGLMASNGLGTPRDLGFAVAQFQAAADKGHLSGKLALGDCLLYGKGIAKDEKRAVALLREAAAANDARAFEMLGTCYERGLGVAADPGEAAELFEKAALGGRARAYANLGVLYIKGLGVPQNARKGFEYFKRGADEKDAVCMFFLAQCYEGGTGIPPNAQLARKWYVEAAQAGSKEARDWCEKNRVSVP